jgi:hypothetical protein
MLPHTLHIGQQFSESSGISNTHPNSGFGIQLLHRLILLAFPMLTLRVVGLTEKSTFDTCYFLGSYFVCWSACKQSSVAQSTIEFEYVAAASYCSQII